MHWGNNDPLIHLYRSKKKKKKKNERTRKDELFLQIFFKRNMINVLHHSEAVYERNSSENFDAEPPTKCHPWGWDTH